MVRIRGSSLHGYDVPSPALKNRKMPPSRSRKSHGAMGAPPAAAAAAAAADPAPALPVNKKRRLSPAPLQQRSGSTTVSQAGKGGNGREEEEMERDAVSTPVSGCSLNTVINKGLELLKQRDMGGVARMMMEGVAMTSPMKSAVDCDHGEEQRIDDIWKTVAKKVLREMNMKFIDIDGKEAEEPKVNGVLEEVEKPDNDDELLELTQALYHRLMAKKQEQVEMKFAVQQLYTRMVEAESKLKQKENHLEALEHDIEKVKDEVGSVRSNLQQELKECEKKLSFAKQEASAAAKQAFAAKEEASAVKKEVDAAKEKAFSANKEAKVAAAEASKLKREVEELKKKLVNKDGAIRLLNKSIMDPHGTFEKVYHDYTKLKNQLSSPGFNQLAG